MKNTHKTTLTKYLFLHSFSVYLTVLGALYEGLLLLRKHQHLLMFTRTLASPVLQVLLPSLQCMIRRRKLKTQANMAPLYFSFVACCCFKAGSKSDMLTGQRWTSLSLCANMCSLWPGGEEGVKQKNRDWTWWHRSGFHPNVSNIF